MTTRRSSPPTPASLSSPGFFTFLLPFPFSPYSPRHNPPRIGRILMATGRDAADVALTTSFGRMDLVKFLVISDEVAAAA